MNLTHTVTEYNQNNTIVKVYNFTGKSMFSINCKAIYKSNEGYSLNTRNFKLSHNLTNKAGTHYNAFPLPSCRHIRRSSFGSSGEICIDPNLSDVSCNEISWEWWHPRPDHKPIGPDLGGIYNCKYNEKLKKCENGGKCTYPTPGPTCDTLIALGTCSEVPSRNPQAPPFQGCAMYYDASKHVCDDPDSGGGQCTTDYSTMCTGPPAPTPFPAHRHCPSDYAVESCDDNLDIYKDRCGKYYDKNYNKFCTPNYDTSSTCKLGTTDCIPPPPTPPPTPPPRRCDIRSPVDSCVIADPMHGCDNYYDASKNIICALGEIKESDIISQCILGNIPCTTTTLLRPPTPPPTCDILIPVDSCVIADPMHGCDSYYDASKNILCEDDRLSEQCILGNTMCY